MKLADVLDDFFMFKENQGVRPTTIQWYERHLNVFIDALCLTTLEEWNPANINKFLHIKRKTCNSGGLLMYYRVIKLVSKWLYLNEYLEKDITPRIPKPKHKQEQKEGFSQEDVKQLLSAAKRAVYPEFNEVLILTLYDTGIRSGELCNLKLRDIDYKQHEITVSGKTGERTIPIGRKTLRKLKRYINQHRRTAPSVKNVFVSREGKPLTNHYVAQKVARLSKSAGIEKDDYTGPHALRHGFAVQFLRNGGNVIHLRDILGHKDIGMTSRYVLLTPEDLRMQHSKFSPVEQMS